MKKDISKKPSLPSQSKPESQEQRVGPLTQLLIKARLRITDKKKWARGAYARDARGAAVSVMDPEAVCWCAVGTLERECGRHTPSWIDKKKDVDILMDRPPAPKLYHAAHHLLEQAAGTSITGLNDGSGHARVIQMYNQAIKMAKGK